MLNNQFLSRKYNVRLSHYRHIPKKYAFHYDVFFFCLDIDELDQLSRKVLFFSYNKFNLFSIYDKQYLEKGAGSIKGKMYSHLDKKTISKISRIELVTVPQYFGYVFNPVSFYICYNNENIECVLVEVANTYKERHIYILDKSENTGFKKGLSVNKEKHFFVSPFNNVSGGYSFKVNLSNESLDIGIDLNDKNGKRIITTKMIGESKPITNGSLIKTIIGFPFSVLLTMTRITYQGILLKSKKLKIYLKPQPNSIYTIRQAKIPFHRRFYFYLLGINRFFKSVIKKL